MTLKIKKGSLKSSKIAAAIPGLLRFLKGRDTGGGILKVAIGNGTEWKTKGKHKQHSHFAPHRIQISKSVLNQSCSYLMSFLKF